MTYETQIWPFLPARYVGEKRTVPVRLVVIHDMEAPEVDLTAENVARYFQDPEKPSSAHICVDNNSIVQCVKDSYVAYAAPGCNHDGIQIELAGYGGQKAGDWLDRYSLCTLALGADATAQYCLKYELPPVHLSNAELKAGKKGIIGHYQATRVYPGPDRTHEDPGLNFPWAVFMSMVVALFDVRK